MCLFICTQENGTRSLAIIFIVMATLLTAARVWDESRSQNDACAMVVCVNPYPADSDYSCAILHVIASVQRNKG